jgi:glycosyltransferase involved in cell wall biosynthesis
MVDLSVVIPIRNEEENIQILYSKLKEVLNKTGKSYEVIFIDDGSTDNSFEVLQELKKKNKTLKVIQFGEGYGKSYALSAGFSLAKGKYIITIDGDLQDDPEEIPKFIEKIKDLDLVVGWRYERQDPITKRLPSKIFNKLTSMLTGIKIHDCNCGFKIFRRELVDELNLYGELHRYIPALANWKGYKVGEIKVRHNPRKYGKTKYGFLRLIKGFLDLITIKFLMEYSKRPLHLFGTLGIILFLIGFLICMYMTYLWFLGMRIWDRPILLLGVLLILMGAQFFSMGLLGELVVSTQKKSEKLNIKKVLE